MDDRKQLAAATVDPKVAKATKAAEAACKLVDAVRRDFQDTLDRLRVDQPARGIVA